MNTTTSKTAPVPMPACPAGTSAETLTLWAALRPKLSYLGEAWPAEAVAELDAHAEALAPLLVQELVALAAEPEPVAADPEWALHLIAMHWLAVRRDARAYGPLLAIGALDGHLVMDELLGDVVHQSYGRCLAAVCDGNLAPLRALVENAGASIWVRMAALDGWAVRVLEGQADRAELMAYLADLGEREAAAMKADPNRQADPDELTLLDAVATLAADLSGSEMHDQLRGWFDAGLLNPEFADWEWMQEQMDTAMVEHIREMRDSGRGFPTDLQAELAWWYEPEVDEVDEEAEAPPQLPYIRETPKVGRNDPCPCGSGKKYKKCCGA
jgi:hypothetical protein